MHRGRGGGGREMVRWRRTSKLVMTLPRLLLLRMEGGVLFSCGVFFLVVARPRRSQPCHLALFLSLWLPVMMVM